MRNLITVSALLALLIAQTSASQDEEILVLTSLPVTYAIGQALTKNTSITVQSIPDPSRRMTTQPNYFAGRAEKLRDTFEAATAVITVAKIWPQDPLYTAARNANIRVIEIDATKPWSTTLEGIAVIVAPNEDARWAESRQDERNLSPWFWLSPSNAVRSADIVARDLKRIALADAAAIEENLVAFRTEVLDLKREYDIKFSQLSDVTVFALAAEFVYLTTDLGLFVDGYFLKQDIRWTGPDYQALEDYLTNNRIRVVIHKWAPAEPIAQSIANAGAVLVVLDTGDGALTENRKMLVDGFQQQLRSNLELLYQALAAAKK